MKELLSVIQEADDEMDSSTTYWYRGHSDSSYQLVPSLFRPFKDGNGNITGYYDEAKLLKEFVRIHPEAREKHINNLELLTYAQHYGLPTRLLDWTTNLLVAIFFACKDNADKDANLVIYKPNLGLKLDFDHNDIDLKTELYGELPISRTELDEHFFILGRFKEHLFNCDMFGTINGIPTDEDTITSDGSEPELNLVSMSTYGADIKDSFSKSVPYFPIILNERLRRQQGCFTLHGGKITNGRIILPIYSIEEEYQTEANDGVIKKIFIAKNKKALILRHLLKLGINEAFVFPELEYQTKSILSDCITKKDSEI